MIQKDSTLELPDQGREYYVYVYLDTRKPGNYQYDEHHFVYEPFYVGKGFGNRLNDHLVEVNDMIKLERSNIWIDKNSYNPHKAKKIKKILGLDLEPIIIKVEENCSDKESQDFEKYLIKIIGRFDKGIGPLTNMTDGGDGGNTINGRKCYINQNNQKYFEEGKEPKGWENGSKTKNQKWYNNGIEQGKFHEGNEPRGWLVGVLDSFKDNKKGENNPSYGKKYFNNGILEELFRENDKPEGWMEGRLPFTDEHKQNISNNTKGEKHHLFGKTGNAHPSYGKKYFNNGIKQTSCYEGEQPEGWVIGILEINKEKKRGKNNSMYGKPSPCKGKRKYNNGEKEKYFIEGEQSEGYLLGRLPYTEKHKQNICKGRKS